MYNTCKSKDCFIIVAVAGEEYCRSCRAKRAVTVQDEQAPIYDDVDYDPGDFGYGLGIGIESARNARARATARPPSDLSGRLYDSVSARYLRVENSILPFPVADFTVDRRMIQTMPQRPFRPEALVLFGVTDATWVENIVIGQQTPFVSAGAVPGSLFATAKTYEKLCEDFAKNGISPPSWLTFRTCEVGNLITLDVRGPLATAVMLGKMRLKGKRMARYDG